MQLDCSKILGCHVAWLPWVHICLARVCIEFDDFIPSGDLRKSGSDGFIGKSAQDAELLQSRSIGMVGLQGLQQLLQRLRTCLYVKYPCML